MKTRLLLFAACLFSFSAWAQITVTDADVVSIGDTRYMADNGTNNPSIAPGSTGNQTWDFSTMTPDYIDTLAFIDPASTQYASSFPNANLALEFDGEFIYLMNNASGLYLVGYGFGGSTFSAMEQWTQWPLNYGDVFSSSVTIDSIFPNNIMPFPGADIIRYKKDSTISSEVDAWGDITIPGGTFPSLRVKRESGSTDSVFYKSITQSYTVTTVGNTFDEDTLLITVGDTVFFTGLNGPHDVTEVDMLTWAMGGNTYNGGLQFMNDSFHVFTQTDTIFYVCSPHASMGMKGAILVSAPVQDWTLFTASSTSGEVSYAWWTNDADTAGLPLVEMYMDGNTVDYTSYIHMPSSSFTPSWNCVANACVDPGDGSGMYSSLSMCQDSCTTGNIVAENIHTIEAYPNPAQDHITFEVKEKSLLSVYNSNGHLVLQQDIFTDAIAIQQLAPGLYHYTIVGDTNNSKGRFQKVQ